MKSWVLMGLISWGALTFVSCSDSKDEPVSTTPTEKPDKKDPVTNVKNPMEGKQISYFGETVTVSFQAVAEWTAEVKADGDWVTILETSGEDKAGKGSVMLQFKKNEGNVHRTAALSVKVAGFKRVVIADFEQAASGNTASAVSKYLNAEMDKVLKEKYLWNTEYAALPDLEMEIPYDEFLGTNLPKLGDVNIEDGGIYRSYSANRGKRYIYSYIQELGPNTRASQQSGLGLGPTFASNLTDTGDEIGLAVGYVYDGSPAKEAGMQRGDVIYKVNGTAVREHNYQNFMQELFYSPVAGTYQLHFYRFVLNEALQKYEMKDMSATLSVSTYLYNPILFANIYTLDLPDGSKKNVAYVGMESFDIGAQAQVENVMKWLGQERPDELVLDFRFNVGGAVAQSRYMTSAIAGAANKEKVFAKLEFVDKSVETWNFARGNDLNPDGLGQAPDLGLKRVFVIMSENTASAAEMLVNSLKGIDFEVITYGSRSEGKNVGMEVQTLRYNGRMFEFAPITFRVQNAKGFADYADGFEPDYMLNNQNSSYKDDIDNLFPYAFGDWDELSYNLAFYWVYCHIMGTKPDFETSTRSLTPAPFAVGRPMKQMTVTPKAGRYGNLIYRPCEE